MKIKILFFSLLLTFSASSFAQWFPGIATAQVLPSQVVAQIYNPHYVSIICSGQVFGQTSAGPVLTSGFIEHFITPGTHRFAFVTTNAFAPFVHGWANFHCRYW